MYSIEDLSDILGYSEHQVRRRLDQFSEVLDGSIQRGAKNKILLDNNGLEILQREKELEHSGKTIAQALNTIKEELNGNSSPDPETREAPPQGDNGGNGFQENGTNREGTKLLQRQLEVTNQHLQGLREDYKEQLAARNREIERLHEIIHNRLPAPKEESNGEEDISELSFWQVFKTWLKSTSYR